jgi:hypothetical protein
MLRTDNYSAALAIANGVAAQNLSGSFYGGPVPVPAYSVGNGKMPHRTGDAFVAALEIIGGEIEAFARHYSTIIAVKIGGVWLMPDVNYSVTSRRHQSNLRGTTGARWFPWDASPQEIVDVFHGYVYYSSGKCFRGNVTRLAAA